MEKPGEMGADERFIACCVGVHPPQNFHADVALLHDVQRASNHVGFPFREILGEPEVGIEKLTSGSEHTCDLPEEGREVRVAMGGFDVEHRVER
tara:strand:- start:1121 stop:1402 length:282 start_codon:yes stop_codon:yes gene_type:complete